MLGRVRDGESGDDHLVADRLPELLVDDHDLEGEEERNVCLQLAPQQPQEQPRKRFREPLELLGQLRPLVGVRRRPAHHLDGQGHDRIVDGDELRRRRPEDALRELERKHLELHEAPARVAIDARVAQHLVVGRHRHVAAVVAFLHGLRHRHLREDDVRDSP